MPLNISSVGLVWCKSERPSIKKELALLNASLRSSKLSWKKKATKAWKTSVGNCTTLTNLSKKLPQVETWGIFYSFLSRENILFLVLGIFHFYREKKVYNGGEKEGDFYGRKGCDSRGKDDDHPSSNSLF